MPLNPLLPVVLMMSLAAGLSHRAVFLSSFSSVNGDRFQTLVSGMLAKDLTELVYIPTASYVYDPTSPRSKGEQRRRARYDAKQKMSFIATSLGISQATLLELDAAGCTRSSLQDKLGKAKLIYVDGGNTFYLQKHIIATEFWSVAKESLGRGSLYMGSSAGAIVAGSSIKTAFWKGWDDPAAATEIEWNEDTLMGARLSAFSVFPHYEPSAHDELIKTRQEELDHPVVAIGNHQAVVVDLKKLTHEVHDFSAPTILSSSVSI